MLNRDPVSKPVNHSECFLIVENTRTQDHVKDSDCMSTFDDAELSF